MSKRVGKLYTFRGHTGTLQELSAIFGINHRTLYNRLYKGWSLDLALSTPVAKEKMSKTPTVITIGTVSDVPDNMEKRFGVLLDGVHRNSKAATELIRKYRKPKFYTVGKKYKGSLIAISEDFGCPLSELKFGMAAGKSVSDVLMEGKYFGGK